MLKNPAAGGGSYVPLRSRRQQGQRQKNTARYFQRQQQVLFPVAAGTIRFSKPTDIKKFHK
jgi:hypothetical protein